MTTRPGSRADSGARRMPQPAPRAERRRARARRSEAILDIRSLHRRRPEHRVEALRDREPALPQRQSIGESQRERRRARGTACVVWTMRTRGVEHGLAGRDEGLADLARLADRGRQAPSPRAGDGVDPCAVQACVAAAASRWGPSSAPDPHRSARRGAMPGRPRRPAARARSLRPASVIGRYGHVGLGDRRRRAAAARAATHGSARASSKRLLQQRRIAASMPRLRPLRAVLRRARRSRRGRP